VVGVWGGGGGGLWGGGGGGGWGELGKGVDNIARGATQPLLGYLEGKTQWGGPGATTRHQPPPPTWVQEVWLRLTLPEAGGAKGVKAGLSK